MDVKNAKKVKGGWSVDVDQTNIRIEEKINIVKLFVDNNLQDIDNAGYGSSRLTGKLPNGKEVKARVVGNLKFHCYIFVDNELVLCF